LIVLRRCKTKLNGAAVRKRVDRKEVAAVDLSAIRGERIDLLR